MGLAVRDIIWLAGFLEGEGYFTFNPKQKSLMVGVDSTDEDVIRHAGEIMGLRPWGPYPNGTNPRTGQPYKVKWRVHTQGRKAASWMMTLYSLMGERRRATIATALGVWMTKLPWRGHRRECLRGHPLSGENLYVNPRGQRSCLTCGRERMRRYRAQAIFPNKLALASNSTPGAATG